MRSGESLFGVAEKVHFGVRQPVISSESSRLICVCVGMQVGWCPGSPHTLVSVCLELQKKAL